jgi:methionyl-tRNA synthetase
MNKVTANYYVCNSIPYVNGDPHLGHAMEFVQADTLARYAKAKGHRVIYASGTDEHGSKIVEKAELIKLDPKTYVDGTHKKFVDLHVELNARPDRFTRTTDISHEERSQLVWKALEKNIYKSKFVGLYCVGCEKFVTPTEAKDNGNICPDHNRSYDKVEEENYFFKLSTFADQIHQSIASNQLHVIPETRKHEILAFIGRGLEDISISRPREKISWGIPVPGDKSQVMYVWFEALLNYITVLGYPENQDFKDFWPANIQVIGKDILRFHAAIWPGILIALGLPLPRMLYVHGHVTVDGKKMSKSLGNSISPSEIISKYGVDAFRYYFLRHIPSYDDGDFSWERFDKVYNSELANELGNLVQRVIAMINNYQDGIVGDVPPAEHDSGEYHQAFEICRFDKAVEEVWEQVRGLNQYLDETRPWSVAKSGDMDHLREILAYCVSCILEIADLLLPIIPSTAEQINAAFLDGIVRVKSLHLFPRTDEKV